MKNMINWCRYVVRLLMVGGWFLLMGTLSAQGLPDSEWGAFTSSLKNGCVEHQKGSAVNQALQNGVIDETCECMAQEVTRRAKASPAMVAALRANNRAAMPGLMTSITTDTDGRHVLISCGEQIMVARGGLAASTKKEAQASKEKGLRGKSRSSFTDEFARNCSSERKNDAGTKQASPAQVSGYCRCVAEGVVDQISPQDLVDMMKTNGVGKAIQNAERLATKTCSAKYLN